jgi:50S ribosomal subunit-associated GTPase HflX
MSTRTTVVKRTDGEQPNTTEIRGLAEAAGYGVVDELTQIRPEDSGTYLGRGRVEELATTREAIADFTDDPIGISTTGGTNIDELRTRIIEVLPNARVRLLVPNSSDGICLISWVHDHATAENISYDGEHATIDMSGRPEIVE